VIGADDSLTGYGGGLARKQWLLEHEGHRLRRGRVWQSHDLFHAEPTAGCRLL
jgi:hypothetical protein